MTTQAKARPLLDPAIAWQAVIDSFRKLTLQRQIRNPVMFVVYVGSILSTLLFVHALIGKGEAPAGFILAVSVWLWFTVLFANFAEAMAEGRGKAQAASLRKARRDIQAKRLPRPERGAAFTVVPGTTLREGDVVLVEAGDFIPADGEVIEGIASVNEAAITGESAPVIRESGGDRSSVTGGTQVLSDWLIVRVSANPGEAFLDRIIALVEGAKRQKTPNEIALDVLLAALTIVFLLACATLLPYSLYSVGAAGQGTPITITVLFALLVCLIPTTIGGFGASGYSPVRARRSEKLTPAARTSTRTSPAPGTGAGRSSTASASNAPNCFTTSAFIRDLEIMPLYLRTEAS